MTNKISKIFDYIFCRIVAALIVFMWTRYFTGDMTVSLIITCGVMAVFVLLFDLSPWAKKQKANSRNTEKKQKEAVLTQLIFNPMSENLMFFESILSKKYITATNKNCLLIQKNGRTVPVFCRFSSSPLNSGNIIDAVKDAREAGAQSAVILCADASNQAYNFAACVEGMEIEICDGKKVFALMKESNLFPEVSIKLGKVAKRRKLKELAAAALNKSRAKGYFLAAALLLFSSFFVIFPLYYRIGATVLLIVSLISLKDLKFSKNKDRII